VFLAVLIGGLVYLKWREVHFQQQGDLAFARGEFDHASDYYERAKKGQEKSRTESRSFLRMALVQLKRGNLETMKSRFGDALSSSSKTSYVELEKIARKLKIKLDDNAYFIFREEEIRCLRRLLTLERIQDRRDIHEIERRSSVIQICPQAIPKHSVSAEYDIRPANVQMDLITHKNSENSHVDIELCATFEPSHILTRQMRTYASFPKEQTPDSDETIAQVLNSSDELKSKINQEICDDMYRVVDFILCFCEGRRLINDIDHIIVTVKKTIPVFWFENTAMDWNLLSPTTTMHYSMHRWKLTPTITRFAQIDLSTSKTTPLIRETIKSQLGHDQIRLI
jgi:hypothetical protein